MPESISFSIHSFCSRTISILLTCQFFTVRRSGQSGQFCILYCICRHGEFVCQCHGLAIVLDVCRHILISFADLNLGRFAGLCEFIAFICFQGSCQCILFSGFECCYFSTLGICPCSHNGVSFWIGRNHICRFFSFYRCNSRKHRCFDDFIFRYWRCSFIFFTDHTKFCCVDMFVYFAACCLSHYYFYFCNPCMSLCKSYFLFFKVLICTLCILIRIGPSADCSGFDPLCAVLRLNKNFSFRDRTTGNNTTARGIKISRHVSKFSYSGRILQCDRVSIMASQLTTTTFWLWFSGITPVCVPDSSVISIHSFCSRSISSFQFFTVCFSSQSSQFCILYFFCDSFFCFVNFDLCCADIRICFVSSGMFYFNTDMFCHFR